LESSESEIDASPRLPVVTYPDACSASASAFTKRSSGGPCAACGAGAPAGKQSATATSARPASWVGGREAMGDSACGESTAVHTRKRSGPTVATCVPSTGVGEAKRASPRPTPGSGEEEGEESSAEREGGRKREESVEGGSVYR
jgi:hypothetical protein